MLHRRRSRRARGLEPAARRFRSERADGSPNLIDGAAWIVVLVQILCVDLLLGVDNAVVIAFACSRLPAEETRRAVMLGAVGAIAVGSFWLLALGVVLSIPIIAYGSLILTQIIRRAPEILTLGAVVLGWIAGEMAVSDPLVSGWIQTNAPALAALAPPLVAVFALVAGRGARK